MNQHPGVINLVYSHRRSEFVKKAVHHGMTIGRRGIAGVKVKLVIITINLITSEDVDIGLRGLSTKLEIK